MVKILVTFASKHGSTSQIADVIGRVLKQNELYTVDVMPMTEVNSIEDYDVLVLGSAIYADKWLATATTFVQKFQSMLVQKPLYLFSSGPLGKDDNQLAERFILPKVFSHFPHVRDSRIFHGALDLRKLSIAEIMRTEVNQLNSGDFRQWDAIKLWAQHISDDIMQVDIGA